MVVGGQFKETTSQYFKVFYVQYDFQLEGKRKIMVFEVGKNNNNNNNRPKINKDSYSKERLRPITNDEPEKMADFSRCSLGDVAPLRGVLYFA